MFDNESPALVTIRRHRRVVWALLLVAVALGAAHFAAIAVYGTGSLPSLVDLNAEGNPVTWFSATLHLVSATLLALVASTAPRPRRRWWVLAIAVLAASFDEVARIHDRSSDNVEGLLQTSGVFAFAWVVPAMVVVAVIAVLCIGVLLPTRADAWSSPVRASSSSAQSAWN